MKNFFPVIILLLILIQNLALGQQGSGNKLNSILPKKDLDKLNYLSARTTFLSDSNPDSSFFYARQGADLAKKLRQPLIEAGFLTMIGYSKRLQGNLSLALEPIMAAFKIAEDPDSEKNADTNFLPVMIGFSNSYTAHQQRIDLLTRCHFLMGTSYKMTGNGKLQLKHLVKAKQLAEGNKNMVLSSMSHSHLGNLYLSLKNYDSAFFHTSKSIALAKRVNFNQYVAINQYYLGGIYLARGNFKLAKEYLYKAIETAGNKNQRSKANTFIALSSLYLKNYQLDSSLYYAKSGLTLAKKLKVPASILNADTVLYAIYKAKLQPDSALVYLEEANSLKDKLSVTQNIYQIQEMEFKEQLRLKEIEKAKTDYRNKINLYLTIAGLGIVLLITLLLYRNNRQRKKANLILSQQKEALQNTLVKLRATQSQLIQSEKMASLGELTAGIAHEIQNPLNFVNNFSEVSIELIDELKEELQNGDTDEALVIATDVQENLGKINLHGKRADSIVKGMLQHSRQSSGQKEFTDINALVDEYLRLSYHGLRAKDNSFNAALETNFDPTISKTEILPQDLGRVLLNLFNNAFYALQQKSQLAFAGEDALPYQPHIRVSTEAIGNQIQIKISDNGIGIPKQVKNKIFQPFFTTKPTGQGTSLGLSLSYDIITRGHGGELKVETEEGEGADFFIILPLKPGL